MEEQLIGLVTIGQPPRTDVLTSMFGARPAFQLIEAGALDGMAMSEILALSPVRNGQPLVTRLADGSEVVIGKHAVLPHLQHAVNRVVDAGADIVCVLCTGEFPTLEASVRLVFPDRLLWHTVEALLPAGTLGVLMPHVGQRESMARKWTTAARLVVTSVASPYAADQVVDVAARSLVDVGAELVVMDCMGYDRAMLQTARAAVNVPVLLANGVVAAVLSELAGSRELAQVASRG